MVLIYDDSLSESADLIRNELLRQLIPCAVERDLKFRRFALVTVLYMDERYDADIVGDDPETVLLADREALKCANRRDAELKRLVSRIEDVFFIKYGFDPYVISRGAVYDSHEGSRCVGRRCKFTHAEKLIIRFIATAGEKYADSETIRKFCLQSDTSVGAVTVHINKINRRASFCSPIKLISSKHFSGYRLTKI